jgi:prepilin-type N-terminal cleavage/methylation domain-containing protein
MARSRRTPRRAFTLLEVILVLALLVVLAAIAWPGLQAVLSSLELRKSADRIRLEWEHARCQALSSGSTVLFRYAPDSNRYCLERLPEPQFAPGTGGTSGASAASATSDDQPREEVLPERITMVDCTISDDAADSSASGGSTAQGEWSDPVVFYPDGTTSDATLVLQNQRDQSVEVSVRGLTGVVTVGEIGSEGEP